MSAWYRRLFTTTYVRAIYLPIIIVIAGSMALLWPVQTMISHFQELQGRLSAGSIMNQALAARLLLQSQIRENLRLYAATSNPYYLEQLEFLEKQRLNSVDSLRRQVTQLGPDAQQLESFFAGSDEARDLRMKAIQHVRAGEKVAAERSVAGYLVLSRINNARLDDLRAFVSRKIQNSENELADLVHRLPFYVLAFIILEGLGVYFVGWLYRRQVLRPLADVVSGMEEVARGNLRQRLKVSGGSEEMIEVVSDFNAMATALEKAHADLSAAKAMAEQSARFKSEFLSNMSHEIRTPLNVIVGLSDILREKPHGESSRAEIDLLAKSSQLLLRIVNDILDHSRLESGKIKLNPQPTDVRATLDGLQKMLLPMAQAKNLELKVDIGSEFPPSVMVDEFRLQQILLNLLNNAIKFTNTGGVTLHAHFDPPNVFCFEIKDTGIGIHSAQVERIFSRFEQAEPSIQRQYGGTGLGLAIVKQLTQLFAGEISVQSSPGQGTKFFLRLPLDISVGQVSERRERPLKVVGEASRLDSARILLVDDSADNRFLIQAYLGEKVAEIVEAENGQEALEKYQARPFDLVLMDIQMPVMDGFEAMRRIREWESGRSRPQVPIVALTALSLPEEIQKCRASGCTAYVLKPVRKKELFGAMNASLLESAAP